MKQQNRLKVLVPLAALFASMVLTSCCDRCADTCHTSSCCRVPCDASCVVTSPGMPATPAAQVPPTVEVKPAVPTPEVAKPAVPTPEVVKPATPKTPDATPPATADRKAIRIRAGSKEEWKDKDGNVWSADAGFSEGALVDLGKLKVEGTDNPQLYTSEHSNMESFSQALPNGKYTVKLHFIESPDDVKKEGERLFSIDVMGEKMKSFDIFKEAGGANKALVKTFHVNVTEGRVQIGFKSEQKEALVNGIEIIPE